MNELKHYDLIMNAISILHEPWMSDCDKKEFSEMIIEHHGKALDEAIEEGIKLGYSVDLQRRLIGSLSGTNDGWC